MKKILFYISCILGIATTKATSLDEYFQKAQNAYNDGNYQKAIEYYSQILDSEQESVALYYNLANAYYKNEQVAPSIYYYEKALLLDPNDPEVKNNLAFAQRMTIDKIIPTPKIWTTRVKETIIFWYSTDGWAIQAIVNMLLCIASFLAYYFLSKMWQKRLFFTLIFVFGIISIGSYTLGSVAESVKKEQSFGIVFEKKIAVYTEPNAYSQEIFSLHEGTKIQIIDSLNDWSKIVLPDGKSGWIKRNEFRAL